jgi:hypothetical protein
VKPADRNKREGRVAMAERVETIDLFAAFMISVPYLPFN